MTRYVPEPDEKKERYQWKKGRTRTNSKISQEDMGDRVWKLLETKLTTTYQLCCYKFSVNLKQYFKLTKQKPETKN